MSANHDFTRQPVGAAHERAQKATVAGRSHEQAAQENARRDGTERIGGDAEVPFADLIAALQGFTTSAASLVQLIGLARLIAKAKQCVMTDTTADGKRSCSVTLSFGDQPDVAGQFFMLASAFVTPDPETPDQLAAWLKKTDDLHPTK